MQAGVTGWLQYLFPVVGSLGAMLFIFANPKPLYIASALLFMLGSIGMGVGMAAQQRLTARRRTEMARARYLRHMSELAARLRSNAEAQRTASAWRHPPPAALLDLVVAKTRLWERRPTDPDFLQLRAGLGAHLLVTPISEPARDPTGSPGDPVCWAAADALAADYGVVDDVITLDLKVHPVVSVVGSRDTRLSLARAICAQLAVLQAPEDVGLLLVLGKEAIADWSWAKWLPQLQEVGDEATLEAVVSSRVGQARTAKARGDLVDPGPWLVAVADGVVPSHEVVGALQRIPCRTALIVLAGDPAAEPSADARLEVGDGSLRLEVKGTPETVIARADGLGAHGAEAISRLLAPLHLNEDPGVRRLADTISLPGLLGVDAARLDPSVTWRDRPLPEILRVPLGVSAQGEPVILDLKESALGGDGPHGLAIGATGSGKSELLRSIVTGLAVTHAPDLVSFVLVDFKGGAAFAGLQDLPHVAGLITNLADDLAMVDRMHAALFGEIHRRQELLRDAGNLASLREYHRRRAEGADLAPLPYLLFIVDEFGELLASRPDFIDLFVAVGRLGRSLGMHLLLSSQQLDEGRLRGLEGHLSYRIALRTFSAAESRVVLGVPDAYELPPVPGSAYLKVGTTTYTRFRAALVSEPMRADSAPELDSATPRLFVLGGQRLETPVAKVQDDQGSGPTVLDTVVARLRDAAPKVHQVWLPPLETGVTLDSVLARQHGGGLSVPVGLLDKPAEQARGVLDLDFSGSAGHLMIAGASLTGKSTLLRTLIAAFALTHSPSDAQFYCVDFGGGGLATLADVPHVGGVAGRQDTERVRRTVAEVASMLDDREARFAAVGIDSAESLRARRARGELEGEGWADVFLVIDNWPAVRSEHEDLEALVQEVAARGLGYAVHLVLTAGRWIDVRSSLREAIGGRLELRLHDPAESAINRRAAENVARGVPGRGITAESLQFQAAMPRIDGETDALNQQRALERLVSEAVKRWPGPPARPIMVLPALIRTEDMPDAEGRGVALGLSEHDLAPVFIDFSGGDPHFLIFGDGESGKTSTLRTLALGLTSTLPAKAAQILVIDYRRTLLGSVGDDHLLGYAGAEPAAAAQVAEAAQVLTRRLPPADLAIDQLRARSWWQGPELYVLVDDYDLVAAASGNPLQPLLGLLAQARDVGLHVVIARRTGGAARGILEPILLRLRELGTPGLLLSGDPQEGPLLGGIKATTQPAGRGTLVRRRERPVLVQVAFSEPKG
jgi:S-DNA-T family DNA segregation ATPase FtsK/SpoIIIE